MVAHFKARLEAMQDDVSERLSRINNHIHQREPVTARSTDEVFSEHQNDDVVQALEVTLGTELAQIERALKRIERGDFGVCRACRGEIGDDRLSAIPFAETCVDCAERG